MTLEQSAASRRQIEQYLKTTKTQLWIEHDFNTNAKLKKAPASYRLAGSEGIVGRVLLCRPASAAGSKEQDPAYVDLLFRMQRFGERDAGAAARGHGRGEHRDASKTSAAMPKVDGSRGSVS